MHNEGGTLQATESRLAPMTLALTLACALLGATPLALSLPSATAAWGACLVAWLLLSLSNVDYLMRHELPTVGMVPVAAMSLGPAGCSVLVTGGMPSWLVGMGVVLVCVGVLVDVVLCACFVRMRCAYAARADVADDAAIIVLGGMVRDGKPKETLALRLDKAACVLHDHPQARLVLSGGRTRGQGQTEADAMAAYLVEKGVGESRVLLERDAQNTRENLERSEALLRERGIGTQRCVLSSDYHLYRALHLGNQLGMSLTPIAAPTPLRGRLQQWSREALTILATGVSSR